MEARIVLAVISATVLEAESALILVSAPNSKLPSPGVISAGSGIKLGWAGATGSAPSHTSNSNKETPYLIPWKGVRLSACIFTYFQVPLAVAALSFWVSVLEHCGRIVSLAFSQVVPSFETSK